MKIFKLSVLLLALTGLGLSIVGCDSGGPNPKVEEARVNKNLEMRKLFDKSHGDYGSLEPGDKATMDKLAGGEAAAQAVFADMKKGPGGGPSTPPSGMPGQ